MYFLFVDQAEKNVRQMEGIGSVIHSVGPKIAQWDVEGHARAIKIFDLKRQIGRTRMENIYSKGFNNRKYIQ